MKKLSYIQLLKDRYNSLYQWEPDYEEHGIQFGPSNDDLLEIETLIKEIEPTWKNPDEKRKDNEQKIISTICSKKIIDIPNVKVLSGKDYDFVLSISNKTLNDLSEKQLKWFLNIIARDSLEMANKIYEALK